MDATKTMLIPGPAQALLTDALDLPDASPVYAMLREIERLKMAAAEGASRQSRRRGKRLSVEPEPDKGSAIEWTSEPEEPEIA